jgi:hypothetical protein
VAHRLHRRFPAKNLTSAAVPEELDLCMGVLMLLVVDRLKIREQQRQETKQIPLILLAVEVLVLATPQQQDQMGL